MLRRFKHLGIVIPLVAVCALVAQQPDKNPFTKFEDIAEGRRLYRLDCINCHGMDGKSGRGARLASKFRRHGSSDREMFRTISDGISDTEMPGLWRDADSVWKILAFVRMLEATASEACVAEAGDPQKGREVFVNKGSCTACHTVGMGGGRLGPDLTFIGVSRSYEYLRESLVDPANDVPPSYRTVRAVDAQGARFEGVLLKEDGYTVHLLDHGEEIRSFSKADLRQLEKPKESLMPSYRDTLDETEMNHLLAYLCGLTGPDVRASR
jgi:putative heme-binding domain-containing protein